MNEIISIEPQVLDRFPSFRRGVVIATQIDNQGHDPHLEELLNEAIGEASQRPIDLKTDPRFSAWDEAHRAFGSNPNKFPPAHKALRKRVQRPGVSLPFINKVVAIMNFNSIEGCLPVGGDDLDKAGASLELRFAKGGETFEPLGNPGTVESPPPGEIVYVAEGEVVMCRRWNWRNGHSTAISEHTKRLVMNIDGLGDGCESHVVSVRDRLAEQLAKFCSAQVKTALLGPGLRVTV